MRKIFFVWSVVILAAACNSKDKTAANDTPKKDSLSSTQMPNAITDSANFTTIQWMDSTFHNMGKMKEGQVLDIAFKFKNTGKKPLVISSVTASCGCTVPEKPEKAFAPGEEGTIRAKFDSNGKSGLQQKTVYVTANTSPATNFQLNFSVEVNK
jgi:hypothetical protein